MNLIIRWKRHKVQTASHQFSTFSRGMAGYKLAEVTLLERSVLILKRPAIRCSPPTTLRPAVPPTSFVQCIHPLNQQEKKSQLKSHLDSNQNGESHHSIQGRVGFTTPDALSLCYVVNPARHQFKWKQYPNYLPASAHSFSMKSEQTESQHMSTCHMYPEHKAIQYKLHLSKQPHLIPATKQSMFDKLQNEYPVLAVNGTLLTLDLMDRYYDGDNSCVNGLKPSESLVQMMMTPPLGSGQRSVGKPTSAQLSFILLKLREELPAFFAGHHSYDMYETNMKFEYNLSSFAWKTETRRSYHIFMLTSRLALQSIYHSTELDLIKITKNLDHGKIEARWRIRGKPRHLVRPNQRVILEGFSTFYVNKDGFIFLHKMDRVMPTPKVKLKVTSWLAQLTAMFRRPALPQPTVAIVAAQPKTV